MASESDLSDGVALGARVAIAPGTRIGHGCVVEDGAVLGKRPVLAAWTSAHEVDAGPAVLAPGAVVGTGAVIFAAARIGAGALVGDQANVRERAVIGADASIGHHAALGCDVRIGAGAAIGDGTWLTTGSVVEDGARVGARVTTTNDQTMGRLPRRGPLRAPVLRRGCTIGAGAVLLPGVEVGAGARIAPGAVVARDVAAGTEVAGAPAGVG